ncbi:protocadherin Fat 4-like [Haliotis rufescens]|uniref:protocadherin Fat 4-like n=1 Tax=Haliotis rufescens TaxID=6454 RepID=UPI00201F0A31|nr:protocadherin Fat 4-like [Haliotis rufescens]
MARPSCITVLVLALVFTVTENKVLKTPTTQVPEDKPCVKGFSASLYTAHVEENARYQLISVPVTPEIRACRDDTQVVYMIDTDTSSDLFWINNRTGSIYMTQPVDYESTPNHRVDLLLQETHSDGSDEGNALLIIDVVDVNDNKPVMTQTTYYVDISEASALGLHLLTLSATDADTGNNAVVMYVLDTPECPIDVDSASGEVHLTRLLDYEQEHSYYCRVHAEESLTDEHFQSNQSTIIIKVHDVNDNSPIFTSNPYDFVMTWPPTDGMYVGTVTAYDRDSGVFGTVNYTMEAPVDSFLSVDQTGDIRVTNAGVDALQKNKNFTFLVMATDDGKSPRMGQTLVLMRMIDGYNRWFFYKPSYNFSIPENTPSSAEVGLVTVNSSHVRYSFSKKYTDKDFPFVITQDGGSIRLNTTPTSPVDHDGLHSSFFFQVAATDDQTTIYTNVTVTITDINDNSPIFKIPSTDNMVIPVSKFREPEAIIYTVLATDKDSGDNGRVTYFILNTIDASRFSIDRTNGDIRTRQSLFNLEDNLFHITVEARDNGSPSLTSSRQISFQIKSESILEEFIYRSITENSSPVSLDLLVGPFKTFPKSEVSFSIASGNNYSRSVANINDAKLNVGSLDYETIQYLDLTVNVTGRTTNRFVGFIHVAIAVQDVNDNRPRFIASPVSTFNIPVTAKSGVPVYQFVAVDKDSTTDGNGVVNYSLGGSPSPFLLDKYTGMLTLNRALAKSDNKVSFTVTANATDGGGNIGTSSPINFRVYDPAEGYPTFHEPAYFGSVLENSPIRTSVMLVNPVLTVFPGEHELAVDMVGLHKSEFYITAPYGDLYTNTEMDAEVTPMYLLAITSTTLHTPVKSTTVFVRINVTDINDNAPHFPFSTNHTTIRRSDGPNTVIATITAVDKDLGAKLNYNVVTAPSTPNIITTQAHNTLDVVVLDPSKLAEQTYHIQMTVDDELHTQNTANLVVTVE